MEPKDWPGIVALDSGIDTARDGNEPDGFVGKIAGDLVAFALTREKGPELTIERIFVSEPLRRKRAGRILLQEIERLAAGDGRIHLSIESSCHAPDFFSAAGFMQIAATLSKKIMRRAEEREL